MALDMIEPMFGAADVEKTAEGCMIETNRQAAPGRGPDAVRLWWRRSADYEPASTV